MILLVAKLGLYVSCRERESLMDADIYSFYRITVFVCSLKVCVLKKTNIVSEASCFKIKLLKL